MTSGSPKDLKEAGNRYFSQGNFPEAVNQYSKALVRSPNNAILYTNRALANLKLNNCQDCIDDCNSALTIETNMVKGYYFMGQALVELQLYEEAINALKKAYSLSNEQRRFYGDDIASALRIAKRKRFELTEEKRIRQEIDLQSYINNLITADTKRLVAQSQAEDEKIDVEEREKKRKEEVNKLFAAVDERRKKREIPDYLCGKISFDIMADPVITPSGITYDRKHLESHLHRVGQFDPITREPLTEQSLIPNLALKDVIDNFAQENPWLDDFN